MNAADRMAATRRARQRVYVSVEVDLGEIDREDLKAELLRRDDPSMEVSLDDLREHINEIHLALNMRDDARVLRIARELVESVTGRIIP